MKDTIQIKLTPAYKEQAVNIINQTIQQVAKRFNCNLNEQDIRKIRNLSLDQININVSQKTKSKTLWIFDAEDMLPMVIEKEDNIVNFGLIGQSETELTGAYSMNPNLSWTFNKANLNKGGLTRKEFEDEVLKMLLEDFETAAFYGALSYITESDINEK